MSAEPVEGRLDAIGSEREVGGPGPQATHGPATRATVDATRELLSVLRVADAPAEALERATALIAEATALLAPHTVEGMRMQGALRPERMDGALRPDQVDTGGQAPREPAAFFPYSPIIGPVNPIAPPAELGFDGERVRGSVTFDARYVGPPEMVHGGVIALLFDEMLGVANVCNGVGGFTGTLTVRYERPTPLGQPLDLEAWVDRTEGRKVTTCGTIAHGGQVTARAEGVFIQVSV